MEQLTIFEAMEKMKQPPQPDPADPLSLPGFAKVKAYLQPGRQLNMDGTQQEAPKLLKLVTRA